MRLACIDIGSNTTRLLVADVEGGALRPVEQRRSFTCLGQALGPDGTIPGAKVREVGAVVAGQLARAAALGASRPRVVGTAAVRRAPNVADLVEAVTAHGAALELLGPADEARFAFCGAVAMHDRPLPGRLAVVDLGGGSCEIAVGEPPDAVQWSASLPLGSGVLTAVCLTSDPPTGHQLTSARNRARAVLADLGAPPIAYALAVGGSATTLRRLLGDELGPAALRRALNAAATVPSRTLAERQGLEVERARLLPAGLVVLEALCEVLGAPLEAGCGGLREGILLAAAAA